MNERIKKELLSYEGKIDLIVNTIPGNKRSFYSGGTDPDYNEEPPDTYTKTYIRRRINVFLSFFYQELIETFTSQTNKEINILDLGSGTGSVQWTIYLLLSALEKMNMLNFKKNINIVNIDSSKPMLDYNKKLWKEFFEEKIKQSKSFTINPTWKCQDLKIINNYNDLKTPSIITASYLLPYNEDDKSKMIDIINRLVKKYKCSLLLTTTYYIKGHGLEGEITSASPKYGKEFPQLFDGPDWEDPSYKGVYVS